ncbi:SDR family oxidoreductase [Thalassiella azotivora]
MTSQPGQDPTTPHPVSGQGVVVTGGAHGIGAAIARRLAAEGARLVVADLDADGAQRVAHEVGGLAVPGDVATEEGVRHLVDAATAHLGRVDVFFANAGVAFGGGPEAPEELWQASWEVNVMAHVRAARVLLPTWLEGGGGRLVVTASAAGLLTMLGAAPYAVTKHAAVAHAEWLAATYGDRGVVVQALCPQGVRTRMLADAGETGAAILTRDALDPEDVADAVAEALRGEDLLILPHVEVAAYYADKARDPDGWVAAMRRMWRHVRQSVSDAPGPSDVTEPARAHGSAGA